MSAVRLDTGINSSEGPLDVFVVSTPMQYLNAREAAHSFGVENALLLILLENYEPFHFEPLCCQHTWSHVQYIDCRPFSPKDNRLFERPLHLARELSSLRELNSIARACGPVQQLFLGNIGAPYQIHIAHFLPHERLIYVGDGMATIQLHQSRRDPTLVKQQALRHRLRKRLLGMRTGHLSQVDFFTPYKLDEGTDRIIINDYSVLREKVQNGAITDSIWLLGQPFIELQLLSFQTYLDVLKSTHHYYRHKYPDLNIYYLPHPREELINTNRLANQSELTLLESQGPVEWTLAKGDTRPHRIASFYSSAIENCRLLFGNLLPVDAIQPSPELWKKNEPAITHAYQYLLSVTRSPHAFVRLE